MWAFLRALSVHACRHLQVCRPAATMEVHATIVEVSFISPTGVLSSPSHLRNCWRMSHPLRPRGCGWVDTVGRQEHDTLYRMTRRLLLYAACTVHLVWASERSRNQESSSTKCFPSKHNLALRASICGNCELLTSFRGTLMCLETSLLWECKRSSQASHSLRARAQHKQTVMGKHYLLCLSNFYMHLINFPNLCTRTWLCPLGTILKQGSPGKLRIGVRQIAQVQ